MCDDNTCAVGRRGFLGLLLPRPRIAAGVDPVVLPNGLEVLPRAAWASGLPHPGALPAEEPGDVRILIVHHSVSPNDHAEAEVVGLLRDFHSFHTGSARGWPDVAYNFFIDRFGRAWEGRAGSLDAPVIGDATGGNQGFSQLVCLIGDFREEPPTPAAEETLVALLAHLAETYGVDPSPGAMTSFVSRGSNRWPEGTGVAAPTIVGHRDMSVTECPGDAAYALVTGDLPGRVAGMESATTTSTSETATSAAPAEPSSTTSSTPETTAAEEATGTVESDDGSWPLLATVGAAGTAVIAGVGAVILRRIRVGRSDRPARPRS